MTTQKPRGIRNNNPGNIRRSNDPWQGLAKEQNDREFFMFKSAVYGIRALARLLITYQDKYGLCTIEMIITRWAPAVENNTKAYIQSVARHTGFAALQTLDMHRFEHLKPVLEAIIQHENGQQPYSDVEITKALVLAGVEPGQKSLQTSRTVKGGQVATAGTLGAGGIEAIQDSLEPATTTLMAIAPYLEAAKWLLLVVTLIGIGVMLWARIDDRRKGLR
ncbi:structural protein P5 [Micavibrio aeruginosavorus]|uniref:Structural protein P5, putative n=1 Tax=Micavibrio aeruginosavorus EPB TaxID=349215 RepID=M4VK97_9BACT|nr:structural protein P5 [Micavibrio aeruginosavorus]AGH98930.1 structural protein P5, putative [Micavibrio aeruginosavorus EPB]